MRLQTGPSRMGSLEIGKCLHHTHPTWKKINCIGLSVSGLLNLCQKIHVTCPFPQPLSQRKTSSSYFQWKYLLIQAGCGNCMSLIPELRRKGKADLCEFRPASAIELSPCLQNSSPSSLSSSSSKRFSMFVMQLFLIWLLFHKCLTPHVNT